MTHSSVDPRAELNSAWPAPHPSRVYDFYLGGSHSFEADRVLAREAHEAAKWNRTAALINRDFGRLSTLTSLDLGIRQFLDLGCGLPASVEDTAVPNLHETVATVQPGCPIVYVDNDLPAYGYARTQLDTGPPDDVIAVHADLLDMEQLLTSQKVTVAFFSDRPVAVTVHDTLPWNYDDLHVATAMTLLRDWMPPGSTLSITHLTDHWNAATLPAFIAVHEKHNIRVRPRSREQIAALFGDLTHLGPGLICTGRWHPASRYVDHPPEHSAAFAGIAVKPDRMRL